jgi:peptide/nickel transport system substrate-binding protein
MKLIYVLAVICGLAACQQKLDPLTPSIAFAIAQAPLNLDPRYATDASSERLNRLLYQALIDFDAQSKPIPQLASWQEVSATQYRFTLIKSPAQFHNGMTLTAHDIVATYQSLLQLKDSPHSAEFTNIARILVIDNRTVDFYLKQPDAQFVAKLIIGILPAPLIVRGHNFSHTPVGSGPLKLLSWDHQLILERSSDLQRISLIEVKDPTVRVLKLLRGEVDLLQGDLQPELVKYLQTKPQLVIKTSVGSNFSYLGFNCKDAQLKNPLVRLAVAHAIDREAIIKLALVSASREAEAILPPEHYTNQNAKALASYDYNPALSQQLLLKAGIKLPLKLVYKTSTDAQRVRLATIMQAQMRPAGIDLEIRSLDWGTFFEDVKQGQFQLYGLTWVGIKTPEIYAKSFATDSLPPHGFNRGQYADNILDQLLAKEDWQAVTARIHQQLPYVPLWYESQFAAMAKNITHYSPKPDGNWDDLATISKYAH